MNTCVCALSSPQINNGPFHYDWNGRKGTYSTRERGREREREVEREGRKEGERVRERG